MVNNELKIKLPQAIIKHEEKIMPITCNLSALFPLKFQIVTGSILDPYWNKIINTFHYLGYKKIPGKRIKYLSYSKENKLLSAIG